MTPHLARDPRQASVLDTTSGDLCEGLLALADQHGAQAQAETEQNRPAAQGQP